MVQADGVHLRVLVLCPRRRFTSFILLTPNSPSRAHTWRAFAGRVLPDAYCRARTAGLSGLQTTWSRRACIERALSVHCACIERALKTRQGRAHWISWCSSKAVAGRAAAVFGVPFCCGDMLYKSDKVPRKDAFSCFRRHSRRVDFAVVRQVSVVSAVSAATPSP
jgi:hypothetical protein